MENTTQKLQSAKNEARSAAHYIGVWNEVKEAKTVGEVEQIMKKGWKNFLG